jgi:hypothetical protein
VEITCQTVALGLPPPWPATVRDVSAGGISLAGTQRLEKGALLHVEVPGEKTSVRQLLACVVQVAASAEERCTVGCCFIRVLTESELRAFLP